MIGMLIGRDAWEMQSYVEMAYPELIALDMRSAEEIKADIIKRLLKHDSI